jgi:hypothetical protein
MIPCPWAKLGTVIDVDERRRPRSNVTNDSAKAEEAMVVRAGTKFRAKSWALILAVAAATAGTVCMSAARADETHAKTLFQAMSDYLAAQQALSFDYDSTLEVVTD